MSPTENLSVLRYIVRNRASMVKQQARSVTIPLTARALFGPSMVLEPLGLGLTTIQLSTFHMHDGESAFSFERYCTGAVCARCDTFESGGHNLPKYLNVLVPKLPPTVIQCDVLMFLLLHRPES